MQQSLTPTRPPRTPPPGPFVAAAALLTGSTMLGFGVWALAAPSSFAGFIDFAPYNEHLLHDVGAFQIGIGVTVLLALRVGDALAVALAGFVAAGSLHAVVHAADLRLGGHETDPWALGALAVLGGAALAARWRRLAQAHEPRHARQAASHPNPTPPAAEEATSMSVFTKAELAYLRGERLARVATVGRDGTPHVTPVGKWSLDPDDQVVEVTGPDFAATKKFRDVARTGRAAIVIDDLPSPWRPRGVEIRGHAEVVDGPRPRIRIHPKRVIGWGLDSPEGGRNARDVL